MRIKLNIILILLFLAFVGKAQTVLFSEDFGTSYSGTYLLTNWCSASSYANDDFSACDGYSWYSYGFGDYVKTNDIAIPATGTTELTFDYKFNSFSSYPTVEISTTGCYGTYTSILTLAYQGSCYTETIDLSAYAGQTINIRYYTWNSSGTFILDNVDVTNTSGGGGGCTDLFLDDFGSSYSGTYLMTNWCSASSYANDNFSACDGYSWYSYGSGDYVKTNDIAITATGTTELSFDYKFNQSWSFPTVEISTTGCYGTYTSIKTLANQGTCITETIDLSAYAGQTINIRYYTWNSSGTFILDNVHVENCASSGPTGSGLKWADNFNDNNLDLDFAGNDGDEDFAGASWDVGTGSLVGSYSATVNYNKTEAFPSSESQGYSIQLDEGEYFESPTIDLSAQEALKISFFVDKSGGTSTDWIGSHVYLYFWDGSSWIQVMSLGGGGADDEDLLASGFGYHCFTAYKSSSSEGNYYYTTTPNVNSAYFNSDFKFKVEIQGWGSVAVHVDNISFRADADGETVIPCGISYWNAPEAIYYGRDTDGAKSADDAKRGVEVEIDDPFGIGTPPDWAGHCNDGNEGTSTAGYYTVWAVVSEQEITNNTYTKLYYTNGTTNVNPNMSQDNTYTGPGYLYYYKLYTGCNSEPGAFDPDTGLEYAFWFDYGSNMPNVYYQLNSTGIEKGGGVTSSDEYLAPGIICDAPTPVTLLDFTAVCSQGKTNMFWSTASEINNDYFVVQSSENAEIFKDIAIIQGAGNSNDLQNYRFETEQNKEEVYYRLKQVDFDGTYNVSDIVTTNCENQSLEIFLNPQNSNVLTIKSANNFNNVEIKIIDISGKVIDSQKRDLFAGENEVVINNTLEKGIYIIYVLLENSETRVQKKIVIF